MIIQNINIDNCHSRIQQGKPPTFIQWEVNGKVERHFVTLVSVAYRAKEHLEAIQKEPDKEVQESYYKDFLKFLK